jgi:uncharacterized membrane protein YdbT with pleckstrin-like domain
MGYIENNLLDNEEIKYKTKNHWIIFFKAVLIFGLGSIVQSLSSMGEETKIIGPVTGANLMVSIGYVLKYFSLFYFLFALYKYVTSEYGVTSQRVIVKQGFFFRDTVEILLNKIESFNVKQHLIGRILGYGDIFVSGTGGDDKQVFKTIAKPFVMKSKVQQLCQEYEAGLSKGQQPAQPEVQSNVSIADEINKLSDLMEKGAITQDEFDEQKRKVLDR